MPRALTIAALAVGGLFALLSLAGGADGVTAWAQGVQTAAQDRLALTLRALHAGTPGALATLWGVCFVYGFAHAVGPGHGKLVLGAYGAGADVPLSRLGMIGMASALGQALTAIMLVYLGAWALGLTRAEMEAASDTWLNKASLWAVLAIGAWLVVRGARALTPKRVVHGLAGAGACHSCGHHHAPDPAQAAQTRTWQDAAAMVVAISLRPCTGALFVLILTWRMGLVWQGVGAVLAMALGTGLVTVAVALAAGTARRNAVTLAGFSRSAPFLEVSAGVVIVFLALHMLNFA